MGSIQILAFAVSLILMLDGPKAQSIFFYFCLIYGLLCDCTTSKSHYFPKREAREEYPVYKGCNLFVWFWWTHPVIFRLILMEASHVFLIFLACLIFPFLGCKPCLNLQFKTNMLPFLGASSNGFNLVTDRNCNQMGTCYTTSDPEKVSKCVVFQGMVMMNLETGKCQ